VFGHCGVGKTTLLTMLYREAVAGRLAGLRLAAADAATATYLGDKVLALEAGQPIPVTDAATDLRFHLYQGTTRVEMRTRDYQGDHVELGRDEPIRAFFQDCDAIWLCLDAATLATAGDRLRRQQEIEQLIEDFLAHQPDRTLGRPVALVLTKADLLESESTSWSEFFDMTRHALQTHCPHGGLFAVSSLGRARSAEPGTPAADFQPRHLGELLSWLVDAWRAQDESRMEELWPLATGDVALLRRCVASFACRYPDAPVLAGYRERLAVLTRQRRRRRGLLAAAAAACLLVGLTTYDAVGYQQAARFENDHETDPVAALERWEGYQTWHPTRNWLRPSAARAEDQHLHDLGEEAHRKTGIDRLADLARQAADPEADAEALWQQLRQVQAQHPEADAAVLDELHTALQARRSEQLARQAQRAFLDLEATEQRTSDLPTLILEADQFLRTYAGSAPEAAVRRRRAAYVLRLDERDIEAARDYSAREPLQFAARRAHFQRYLDKHPGGGAFTQEALAAIQAIDTAWDKQDFRAVRDRFESSPGDVTVLATRCREYLAAHPQGQFQSAARDLLRWTERVTTPGEYRVVLKNGEFDRDTARFFSRGPKLSVELEVAGVRYGPSTIVYNRYDPEWNYEYPRRVRWKLGDPVRIRVTEHSWKDRVVLDVGSAEGDPVGLKLLTGDVWSDKNHVTFESDFALPVLPNIE
jgi:hypothetical protein